MGDCILIFSAIRLIILSFVFFAFPARLPVAYLPVWLSVLRFPVGLSTLHFSVRQADL